MSNIELHIEEVNLRGFSPHDRFRIGAAVERELTRLLSEQGLPPSLSRNEAFLQLDGGTMNVLPNANAQAIGNQLAQTVYGGFTP